MSSKSGRVRCWLIWISVIVVLYAVIGFFVLPPIVKGQIETRGSEALSRELTIGKVKMNPFVFSIAIEDLKIAEDGEDLLASLKSIFVNFDPLTSLFRWQLYCSRIELIEPRSWIRVDSEGVLNVADLIESAPDEEEEGTVEVASTDLPPVGVGEMRVEGSAIDFTDDSLSSPFRTVIGPMNFNLDGLTTRPNEESPYSLEGETDTGETFKWAGTISVSPLGSKGFIQFTGLSIPKHSPYAEGFHNAEVRTGTIALSTDYEVEIGEEMVLLLANTNVAVDYFSLSSPDEPEPTVSMRRIEIDMPEADGVARTANVRRVSVEGVEIAVERRADGTIDLTDWIADQTGAGTETGGVEKLDTADTGPAPSVSIDEISVADTRVRVTDNTTPEPANLVIDQVFLVAKNAGTDLDREVDVDLKMRVNEGGTIALQGTVRALPMAASLQIQGDALELAPMNPYAAQFADVTVAGGSVSLSGTVEAQQASGDELNASWAGDVSLSGFSVLGTDDGTELASLGSLGLNGTEFVLEPLSISANEVVLNEPKAHIIIDENGMINVLTAMRVDQSTAEDDKESEGSEVVETDTDTAGEAEEKTSEMVARATRQKLPFDARIDTIAISGGHFTFSDDSVPGGFSTHLQDFGGTITGLSSENVAKADLDLKATLDGQAPLQVSGQINPLAEDVYSDVTVVFSNISLPEFSPYAGKFIGQTIDSGKLRVDVAYRVSQSELEGENSVLLDQFFLGEKVESPDALKLPVGLALALLRDREGKISLDLPVRGNLDDPDFKYGGVVMKTIGNIVAKAATSPFSMLGGIVGGGGAELDLSYVDFASGSSELTEDAGKKIEMLSKALFERPALRLEIKAPPSPDTDAAGLKEAKFLAFLAEEKARAMLETDDTGVEPAPIEDGEVNDLVRVVFARLFPDEVAATPSVQPTEAEPSDTVPTAAQTGEAAEKRPGFFARLFGLGAQKEPVAEVQDAPAVTDPADAAEEKIVPTLTVAEMRERIMATIDVTEADHAALAAARSQALADSILGTGGIDAERVFIVHAPTVPEGATGSADGGRVFFGLQ